MLEPEGADPVRSTYIEGGGCTVVFVSAPAARVL
uniref:Uncharacterized protein n=1 Tax=Arundo donax TaxID=35708 RepID=A0A0A9FBU9_ARUDO